MERKEYENNWTEYCNKFVSHEPDGFSAEEYLFDAEKEDFPQETQKDISQDDVLERISFHSKIVVRDEKDPSEIFLPLIDFLKNEKIKMAFDFEPAAEKPICVVPENSEFLKRDIWFIGDIHGDLLAFKTVKAFIDSNSKHKPVYVLLGDLFDRNEFGLEVIIEVVSLFKDHPDSIFMIAGNHDDGLSWDNGEGEGKFISSIIPHQFADYLNLVDDELVSSFINEFVKHVKKLPVGLLFPNGLFATHGGIPSRKDRNIQNVWEDLDGKAITELIRNQRDQFLMNRFEKESLSGSKMHPDYSWREIINFSQAMQKVYGVEVRSLLRGHNHCKLCRHEWNKSTFTGNEYCQNPDLVRDVLTMTSLLLMEDSEKRSCKREFSFPSVAHYVPGQIVPKVYSLELLKQDIESYYNEVKKVHGRNSANYIERRILKLEEQKKELSYLLKQKSEELSPLKDNAQKKQDELYALEQAERGKQDELNKLDEDKKKELSDLEQRKKEKLNKLDEDKKKEISDLEQEKQDNLSPLEQEKHENEIKLSNSENKEKEKNKSKKSYERELEKLEKQYNEALNKEEPALKEIYQIDKKRENVSKEIADIDESLKGITADKEDAESKIESISIDIRNIEEEYRKSLGEIEKKYDKDKASVEATKLQDQENKEREYDEQKKGIEEELKKIRESKERVKEELEEITERKKPIEDEYNKIAGQEKSKKQDIDNCKEEKAKYSQWSNSPEGENNDR